jgi:hypothetical protein
MTLNVLDAKRLLRTNSFLPSCAAWALSDTLLKKSFLHSWMTLTFHTALSEMFDKLVARSWVNVAIPHSRGGNELTKFTFSGLGLNIQSSPVTYTRSTHKNLCVADSKRDFFVINRAMHGRGRVDWVMSDRGFNGELRAMFDGVSRANLELFINQVHL